LLVIANINILLFPTLCMNNKAQVSSPFELLVAIIIMSFVVIIGAQMLENVHEQECSASIKSELNIFAQKLKDTSEYRTSNKFEFRLNKKACFNENQAIIKIEKYDDSKKCGYVCGRATNSCFVLIFHAADLPGSFSDVCLNLPIYTSFVGTDDCPSDDPSVADYDAIKPTDIGQTLKSGSYVLKNIAPAGKTYPVICTYRK
jgi:hypothetical protein